MLKVDMLEYECELKSDSRLIFLSQVSDVHHCLLTELMNVD